MKVSIVLLLMMLLAIVNHAQELPCQNSGLGDCKGPNLPVSVPSVIVPKCPDKTEPSVLSAAPHGFVKLEENYYYFSKKKKLWAEAEIDCVRRGAKLALPLNRAENSRLFNYIVQKRRLGLFALGATDEVKQGQWLSISNNCQLQYYNWYELVPPQADTDGLDCLYLTTLGGGIWYEYFCNDLEYYICQI